MLQASPSRGVNAVTGEGLQPALSGADIVVDGSNSPSFEDKAVLHFFETGTRNLIAAASRPASGIASRCRSSAPTDPESKAISVPSWHRSG